MYTFRWLTASYFFNSLACPDAALIVIQHSRNTGYFVPFFFLHRIPPDTNLPCRTYPFSLTVKVAPPPFHLSSTSEIAMSSVKPLKNRGQKRPFFGQFLPRIFSQNHYILWFILCFLPYHHNTSSESRLPHVHSRRTCRSPAPGSAQSRAPAGISHPAPGWRSRS